MHAHPGRFGVIRLVSVCRKSGDFAVEQQYVDLPAVPGNETVKALLELLDCHWIAMAFVLDQFAVHPGEQREIGRRGLSYVESVRSGSSDLHFRAVDVIFCGWHEALAPESYQPSI